MSPAEQEFIKAQFIAVNRRLDGQDEVLERLDHSVHGNGNPGLKLLVDRHDKTIKLGQKIMWIILTPILAALGSGIIAGALYLIHTIK